jgi:hypothetical protein
MYKFFNSLWQEIIFTVVNGLTQNQSLTFSKLKLNKKIESKRLMHLLKIKCTNDNKNFENVKDWFCVSPFTTVNIISCHKELKWNNFLQGAFIWKKIPKTVFFGVNSKTSKSKADESLFIESQMIQN